MEASRVREFFARYRRWLFLYVPSIVVLPLLTARLPLTYQPAREIYGYFQALGLVRLGIDSFFVLTPSETFTGPHLYSIVSSVFVALGYHEGGRFVSFLAALGAVTALALLAARLFDRRVGLLAPLLLWLNPLFMRFSYSFQPEALSIALTVVALGGIVEFHCSDDERFYVLGLFALLLGILTHQWEATIALPMVVATLWKRRYRHVAGIVAVTLLGLGIDTWFVRLQIQEQPLTQYTTTSRWLLDELLPSFIRDTTPVETVDHLSLPISTLCTIGWGVVTLRRRDFASAVMCAWFASAISIGFVLAHGYHIHPYYGWAQLAPLAITGALVLAGLVRRTMRLLDRRRIERPDSRAVVNVLAAILAVSSLGYGLVWEHSLVSVGWGSGTGPTDLYDEYMIGEERDVGAAIQVLRDENVRYASDVVFVGDWAGARDGKYWYHGGVTVAHILIYGDVMIRGRTINSTTAYGATVVPANQTVPPCRVRIVRDGERLRASTCSESG